MIDLRKITFENFEECINLEPKEEQKSFVAPNIRSLGEAYVALDTNDCIPMPYAIYSGDVMVGFIMMTFNETNEINKENTYWICRLMIDKRYQGKGYGKNAVIKALELVKTFPYGQASLVYLSYEPENVGAKRLYASLGFEETGDIEEGEIVAKLSL